MSADNVNANGTIAQLAGLPGQVPYYIFGAGEGTSSNTYQVGAPPCDVFC